MTDQPQHSPGPDLPGRPDLSPGLSKIVIATGNPHKVEELRELLALPGIEFVGLKDLPDHEALVEPEETGTTFEANATIKAVSYAAQTGLPCLADDSGLEVDALGGAPGVISSHYCTDGREVGMTRAERDEANNGKLLRELDAVPPKERTARFVCVIVLASPNPTPPSTPGGRAFQPADTPGVLDANLNARPPEASDANSNARPDGIVLAGRHSRHPGPTVLATSRGTFDGCIGTPGAPPAGVPRGTNGFGYDPLFLAGPECLRTGAELSAEEKNRRSHRGVAAKIMLAQLRNLMEK